MEGVLIVLKGNEPELAAAEARAVMHGWGFWRHKEKSVDDTIFFRGKRKAKNCLGLARKAVKIYYTLSLNDFENRLAKIDWKRLIRGRKYRVVVTKQTPSSFRSRKLANIIWNAQESPEVDLNNPQLTVEIVLTSGKAYVGILAWESSEDFSGRRAHTWPEPHPTAMHPSMARALVNLTCAKRVHDPFCGAGGFVIEAGLSGKKASGADIEPDMIARAKKNCSSFRLHPELRVADAVSWVPRVPAIVTDLPYGKNTKNVELEPLLDAFLTRAKQSTNRIVLGLPYKMPKKNGWTARGEYTSYVHRGITRYFYVLESV